MRERGREKRKKRGKKKEGTKSRVEEVREKASDSMFPGQEKRKWIQESLAERHRTVENQFPRSSLPLTLFLFSLLIPRFTPKERKETSQASDFFHPISSSLQRPFSAVAPPCFASALLIFPTCSTPALAPWHLTPVLCQVQTGTSASD